MFTHGLPLDLRIYVRGLLEYHMSLYSGWHFLITSTDYSLALQLVSSNSTGTDLASDTPHMFLFLKHPMSKDNTRTTTIVHLYNNNDIKSQFCLT